MLKWAWLPGDTVDQCRHPESGCWGVTCSEITVTSSWGALPLLLPLLWDQWWSQKGLIQQQGLLSWALAHPGTLGSPAGGGVRQEQLTRTPPKDSSGPSEGRKWAHSRFPSHSYLVSCSNSWLFHLTVPNNFKFTQEVVSFLFETAEISRVRGWEGRRMQVSFLEFFISTPSCSQ
jgi:hypothetical protein